MATRTASVPAMIYGTAWKKDRTRELVKQALLTGFTAVDTAAQPKHYEERLVGAGIADALSSARLKRGDIYLQTKFTSVHGQDPDRMPYDPTMSITEQVKTSVASSLRNMQGLEDSAQGQYLDCLVLHSPFPTPEQTREAWRAMESYVPGTIRTLGISNIYHLSGLQALYEFAKIKPSVVQNRFYPDTGYDHEIRSFCTAHGIVYQTFWTLTANPHLLRSEPVVTLAAKAAVSKPVALYSLVLGLGSVSILNGTTNAGRMKEDLEGLNVVRALAEAAPDEWEALQKRFESLLS